MARLGVFFLSNWADADGASSLVHLQPLPLAKNLGL